MKITGWSLILWRKYNLEEQAGVFSEQVEVVVTVEAFLCWSFPPMQPFQILCSVAVFFWDLTDPFFFPTVVFSFRRLMSFLNLWRVSHPLPVLSYGHPSIVITIQPLVNTFECSSVVVERRWLDGSIERWDLNEVIRPSGIKSVVVADSSPPLNW